MQKFTKEKRHTYSPKNATIGYITCLGYMIGMIQSMSFVKSSKGLLGKGIANFMKYTSML
jgi:hypothetical protein